MNYKENAGKAVVIGAGIAGIAVAIRLAVQGYQVFVYEKNSYPGGKLTAFEKDGFLFDAGPSLFTQPKNIEALFELANVPIETYFKYQKVENTCNYFFENGKHFSAVSDLDQLAKNLHESLGEDEEAVKKYIRQSGEAYQNIGALFIEHSLHHMSSFKVKNLVQAVLHTKPSYLFKSLHQYNRDHFKTPEAVQVFNRFATYNGSNPYEAPAMLSIIPSLELNEGVYYPTGGMISITRALEALAKRVGVTFFYNTAVQKIEHEQKQVNGVIAGDKTVPADIVVSDSDVYFVYKNLLNDSTTADKILRQERSSSAIIFYWGINKSFANTGLHNILFSKNYREEFDQIFNQHELYHDPTVYINITSKMESNHAPEGCENWFVMINAPANNGQDWKKLTEKARLDIIKKINRVFNVDLEPFIKAETIQTPVDIEKNSGSYMGSLYGTSSNSRMAAFARHPNFSKKIKGLYFVGGSVHPGGGIPLCLNSAKIAADLIADN